ncbi:MAG: tyrosine-type recombinase/integrase [Candidatus Thiodiazotropha sp. (ex Ctena orbiculata)]|nr:tyrosine-type recombinase/integrase [Candidatus Thiodiazotropha taylori]MBT2998406.1 tyrosine-type recombinase/integrase [Candidatus Thiodiazotropha taylori]MBT3002694.1 tyrosine-type recombinase/integrase [Candidatus Thiodiazotropha taylori]MBV2109137.1 tyrosine-type recombinase/integrase [Candidatus Thiodiazotropha taylori]MBV2112924.1 tyrosine-type recombinase/integrase [Candidatus Thiodiazotropha taylori]
MATIRKRGNKYQVQIRKKGFPTLTQSFINKSTALTWVKKIEADIERDQFIDCSVAQQTHLSDILDRYETEIIPHKRGGLAEIPRTKLLRTILGHLKLQDLKPRIIAQYRDSRLQKVKSSTVRRELALLSHVINTAIIDWGIDLPKGNPISSIRLPSEAIGRDRRITNQEEFQLLNAMSGNHLMKSIMVIAIETGMRRGEIAAMQWDHINWPSQTLSIPITKTEIPRVIPLSKKAVETLRELPRRLYGKVWGVRPDSITQAFERACRRAKIEDLRFHDLRHEATSRFFEKGLSIMEVSAITGHKDLRMLKRYTHIRPEYLVKKLGNDLPIVNLYSGL